MEPTISLTGEVVLEKGGPGSGPRPGNKVHMGQEVGMDSKNPSQSTHVIERPASGKSGLFDLREISSGRITHADMFGSDLHNRVTSGTHYENPIRKSSVFDNLKNLFFS
jgi:hypothetical protein